MGKSVHVQQESLFTFDRNGCSRWAGIGVQLAREYATARLSAAEHLKEAWEDALGMVRDTPLTAPLRCLGNNTRLSLHLARSVARLSGDTWRDLHRINRERREHVHLVDRESSRR